MSPFKNRTIQVSFPKGEKQPPQEISQAPAEPVNYAADIQETVRIVSAHVIMGVSAYLLLDTFRKSVIKMVPGH